MLSRPTGRYLPPISPLSAFARNTEPNEVPSTSTRLRPLVALFMRMYKYLMHRRSIIIIENVKAPMTRMSQNLRLVVPHSPILARLMPTSSAMDTATTMKMRYRSSMTESLMTQV